MRAYRAMFSARFRELLQYRAAALAGIGTQVFWGLIRMMIFIAFYERATAEVPMPREHVITYIWLGQAFLAMTWLSGDRYLAGLIRSGNVAYEMLRPVDLYALWFSRIVALRVAPTLMRAAPMLILATLAGWIRWPGPARLAAWAASMLGALALSCSLSALQTITMFWTISGEGINRLVMAAGFLLSGMIVPLPLFPDSLQPIINALPFRGMCDLPYRLFTGHIPAGDIGAVLLGQLAWTVGLVLLGRWLLARAMKRLVVQGG